MVLRAENRVGDNVPALLQLTIVEYNLCEEASCAEITTSWKKAPNPWHLMHGVLAVVPQLGTGRKYASFGDAGQTEGPHCCD